MTVLKTSLTNPSRIQGIYRYLLQVKEQKEKKDILKKLISPDKLVEDKPSERPMFTASLNESIKCGLLKEETINETIYIAINPELPEESRDKEFGIQLLPNTLATLFFASGNQDESDFGLVCAWYLAQDVYNPPKNWEEIEQAINQKDALPLGLKLTNNSLYSSMDDWMSYMGLIWSHSIDKKRATIPDPTVYIRRNLNSLFNYKNEKISLQEFIKRLAEKCPLFETGHFRNDIEKYTKKCPPNTLSTSTSFALFRLQDEGLIKLMRESDADLMILPKANHQIDDNCRISHLIYQN